MSIKRSILVLWSFVAFLGAAFPKTSMDASAAETAPSVQQWVDWGSVVHGGFGSHIALGIRIGQDAMHRLQAQRRELIVSVTPGNKAPCACVADGITVATSASSGQGSMKVQAPAEDSSFLAIVKIHKRQGGPRITYFIPASAASLLSEMNSGQVPENRYRLVMATPQDQLYTVEVQEK